MGEEDKGEKRRILDITFESTRLAHSLLQKGELDSLCKTVLRKSEMKVETFPDSTKLWSVHVFCSKSK